MAPGAWKFLQNLEDRREDQNGAQRNCKCQCLQGQSIANIGDCVDPADKAVGEQEEKMTDGDGKEVGQRQCGICNSWCGWMAMFWALDVWDDMRMLYEDLAMKM